MQVHPPLLASVPNFRDLGGYPATDGRRVVTGQIFRSQAFSRATAEDMERLGELGVRRVCDLRSQAERLQAPNRWASSHAPSELALEVNQDVIADPLRVLGALREAPDAGLARDCMLANYRALPKSFVPVLSRLFEQLLDPGGLPLVFHCTAGKDRTGFAAAMILLAVDVPEQQVLDDYTRTAALIDTAGLTRRLQRFFEQSAGLLVAAEAILPLLEARPEYLDAALQQLAEEHGSVARYLKRCGLNPDRRETLKYRLLSN